MDKKIIEQRTNRIDTFLKAAYTVILCIAAVMFMYAVTHGGVAGEAHIGRFDATEIAYGWTLTQPDGTVVENISLPASVYAGEGTTFRISNTLPDDIRTDSRLSIRAR